MSEHTFIEGKCDYNHIPYREDGFTYCRYCKKFAKKVTIGFHEGILNDWMEVKCGKCKKTIWVTRFKNEEDRWLTQYYSWKNTPQRWWNHLCFLGREIKSRNWEGIKMFFAIHFTKSKNTYDRDDEGKRIFPKQDKKCPVCKKKTNHYDAVAIVWSKNDKYLCSDKCYKKWRK